MSAQARASRSAETKDASSRARRRLLQLAKLLAVVLALPLLGHGCVLALSHMSPPAISLPQGEVIQAPDDASRRELGDSWTRKRGAINEVRLVGDPVTIGHAHVKLLYDEQVAIEQHMHEQFAHFVPYAAARTLIVDLARLRFRSLDETISPSYRQEIAAQAAGFRPDPFTDLMDTYPRMVFLHSLYDIMLSFERSPLIGCTSVVLRGEVTEDGHTILGRNFDFEGPQILDDRKAVFLMFEEGRIPYASVSWPGWVGTTSGMNREGVAVVIHGARAGEAHTGGEPVAQTVRQILGRAHNTREAVAMLGERHPMVPHVLLIADSSGDAAAVERVPGRPPYVRRPDGPSVPLTNHFEGPAASDPKNEQVMERTSTLARRARLDRILSNVETGATVQRAVEILRDKRSADGKLLPLGHRSAIDALIATHSVVMDATARKLWVNEGPHAMGRYVAFDLKELLARDYRPEGPARVESLPADDITRDGRYDAWVKAGRPHEGAE